MSDALPNITWKTDIAGALAALSIFAAFHGAVGSFPDHWIAFVLPALVSGPFWAQLVVTYMALRNRLWRLFVATPSRIRDVLILALFAPIWNVNGFPSPWLVLWMLESSKPSIGIEPLLALGFALVVLWMLVLAPLAVTRPVRSDWFIRVATLGIALGFGVVPSILVFGASAGG